MRVDRILKKLCICVELRKEWHKWLVSCNFQKIWFYAKLYYKFIIFRCILNRFSARFKSTNQNKIFYKKAVENIYVHMQTQVKKIVKYFCEKQAKSIKVLYAKICTQIFAISMSNLVWRYWIYHHQRDIGYAGNMMRLTSLHYTMSLFEVSCTTRVGVSACHFTCRVQSHSHTMSCEVTSLSQSIKINESQ